MKRLAIVFLFICCFKGFCQSYSYDFNRKLITLISEKNNEIPTVFEVKKKELTTKISSKRKVESDIYKQSMLDLDLAIKDSLSVVKENKDRLEQYNQINEIKILINQFIASKEPYELKKLQLVKAQNIAVKTQSNYLIYADDKINPKHKTKYFVLRKRVLDLKVHLKKIVWKIENTNVKPNLIELEEKEKINQIKTKLKSTKQYEYINGPIKSKKKTLLALGKEITSPNKVIDGQFMGLGEYYVVLRKHAGKAYEELVSVEEINPSKTKEQLVFPISASLIKKRETGSLYLVATGFLDEYSLTNLSKKDKFKNKVKLPFKIYNTVNERLIDSIILDYNRVTLNLK